VFLGSILSTVGLMAGVLVFVIGIAKDKDAQRGVVVDG